jgi:ATP-dependent Lhr-like helicase
LLASHRPQTQDGKQTDNSDVALLQSGTEHIARTLLHRYGIVFRKLLERESNLPPWRDLLYVYRRLEARGEIRGGRFVNGFSGEQFALPEALASLRNIQKQTTQGEILTISAVDPVNLTGIITPGKRVSALTGNRILYLDGTPAAINIAGEITLLKAMSNDEEWNIRNALLRNSSVAQLSQHPARAKDTSLII